MSYLPPVWTLANYANTFPETRDYRMTVEMLICALDHPISNLMALAEDFKEEDAVDNIYLLHHRQQNIFLAYKQQAGSILVPKTHGGFMKVSCKL
ncbi:unnamed protein product [Brassica rapa]|uniref:Uncharacterized protein n=2 Tax=Brassica TaxID=3705 RepID=A0A3P5ZLR0_BRACM|nr:unnamed protein product [Brassica napus]CAG7890042.1 unnamed protein product [Brassica rapa]VDC77305.1 unnamed protein product [Brassica rapa]